VSEAIVPDSEARGLLARLPTRPRALAQLARLDRPIGWWLLFWPCAWGLALSGAPSDSWWLLAWLLVGSIVMRGAGCVLNDIVDRDLDARVERTRSRPLPAGTVSLRTAWIWLAVLLAIGLIVWLRIGWPARLLALATLPVVAAYPYMKRITWWPQAFLGIVFGSGAVVGFAAAAGIMFEAPADYAPLHRAMWLLYAGTILWVIGYDTIYALQDKEDDALAGIKSSARAMGVRVRSGVGLFYLGAVIFWSLAFWQIRPHALGLLALAPIAAHLLWQVATLKEDGIDPLVKFRSNRFAGALMFLACLVVGTA